MTNPHHREEIEINQGYWGPLCPQGTFNTIFFLFFVAVGVLTVAVGVIVAAMIALRSYQTKKRLAEDRRIAEAEVGRGDLGEPNGFDKAMELGRV